MLADHELSGTGSLGRVTMRKITSLERDLLRDHFLSLDPVSRRMRFCSIVKDAFIVRYVSRIEWLRSTILGAFVDGKLRGVAELIATPEVWSGRAELAISVQPGFQNRGIGASLLERILDMARNRFVSRVEMICLLENHRMQRLAGKNGATLKTSFGAVEGRITPPWPSYLTLMEEAAAEGEAMFRAFMDVPKLSDRRDAG